MRAGKMDRRLSILEYRETGRNGLNEAIMAWVKVATVWAQARPNRGAERFEAQQEGGSNVMTFHIRYRKDFTVENRVLYKGKTFDVTDVREIGREVVTEFDCVARAE